MSAATASTTNDGAKVVTPFELGEVVLTPGALDALGGRFAAIPFINRHKTNDWGELSDADKQANDDALRTGDRILSKYITAGGEAIYIITEADRSRTTILLPEEY